MTTITIPRALLERALEALTCNLHPTWIGLPQTVEAIRAELAKPKEEPVAASGEDLEVYQSMAENYFNSTPSVVWKATSLTGDTAHFGVRSAAKAWARSGTVEAVPLKILRLIHTKSTCNTCESLARTVMMDQSYDDSAKSYHDAPEVAQELRVLADKFSEGWHDGIKIDASDVMLLSNTANALEQLAALKAERDALEKDAERYRYLRDMTPWTAISAFDKTRVAFRLASKLSEEAQDSGVDLDKAIDAAIAKAEGRTE